MSSDTFYLLGSWRTLAAEQPQEWLGRVVADYESPTNAFAPEDTAKIRGKVHDDPGYKGVSELLNSKRSMSIYAALAEMLRASVNTSHQTSPGITALKVQKISIWQHPQVFERLKEDAGTVAEIRKMKLKDRTAYMIVGLLIADNVKYTEKTSSETGLEVEAKALKELTMAAGGPPMDPVEAGGNVNTEMGREGEVELEGKRIFAIQYRILRRRLVSRSGGITLTSSTLQGDRTFGDNLGAEENSKHTFELVLEEDSFEMEVDDPGASCFDM